MLDLLCQVAGPLEADIIFRQIDIKETPVMVAKTVNDHLDLSRIHAIVNELNS